MATKREVKAGGAYIEVNLRDKVAAGLARLQSRLNAMARGVRAASMAMGIAGGAISGALLVAAKSAGDFVGGLSDISQRLGVSSEFISEMGFIAEQAGSSIDDLGKAIWFMEKNLGEAANGSKSIIDTIESIGVSFEQLRGLAPEEQFAILADALANTADQNVAVAAATKLFGRGSITMFNVLRNGTKTLAELRREAKAFGMTITQDDAKALDDLGDNISMVSKGFAMIQVAIAKALTPLNAYRAAIGSTIGAMRGIIEANGAIVRSIGAVGAGLTAMSAAGFALWGLLFGLGKSLGILVGAWKTLHVVGTAALVALKSPVLLIAAAIAGVAYGVMKLTGLWDSFTAVVGKSLNIIARGIWDAFDLLLSGKLSAAWAMLAASIELGFRNAFKGIIAGWNSMLDTVTEGWLWLYSKMGGGDLADLRKQHAVDKAIRGRYRDERIGELEKEIARLREEMRTGSPGAPEAPKAPVMPTGNPRRGKVTASFGFAPSMIGDVMDRMGLSDRPTDKLDDIDENTEETASNTERIARAVESWQQPAFV